MKFQIHPLHGWRNYDKTKALIEAALTKREELYDEGEMLVGDRLLIGDSEYTISHIWSDGSVQYSKGGQLALVKSGECSFSGGLEPGVSKERIKLIGKSPTFMWFPFDGYLTRDCAVDLTAEVNLYKYE